MEYNVGKCEVIHFGRNNSKIDSYLNGEKLQHATVQRDLGVLVHESQKLSFAGAAGDQEGKWNVGLYREGDGV